jgi:hypothetical protein
MCPGHLHIPLRERIVMGGTIWIGPNGETKIIHTSQDVAEALDNDPETANYAAEQIAKEIEEEQQ